MWERHTKAQPVLVLVLALDDGVGQFDVHPNQITTWKAQLEGSAADVFGAGGGSARATPPVDVKALHARIGELTLENYF